MARRSAILASLLCFALASESLAASLDLVYLKDGTVLAGTVVKNEPGKFVLIRIPDKELRRVPADQVDRLVLRDVPINGLAPPSGAPPAAAVAVPTATSPEAPPPLVRVEQARAPRLAQAAAAPAAAAPAAPAASSSNPCKRGRVLRDGACIAPDAPDPGGADRGSTDRAAADRLAPNRAADDRAAAERAAVDRLAVAERAAAERAAAAELAAADRAAADRAANDRLVSERAAPASYGAGVAARPPPPVAAPRPYAPPPEDPDAKIGVQAAGAGIRVDVTHSLESDRIRQAWLKRGGSLTSYAMSANAVAMYFPSNGMMGGGLGAGLRFGILQLTPPDVDRHETSFFALRIGGGADVQGFQMQLYQKDISFTTGRFTGVTKTNLTYASLTLPGYIGIQGGFGGFDSASQWSGWTIGIDYAPSYNLPIAPSGGSGSFNYLGFALDISHGSMHAALEKLASEAQFKLTFFFLPPISDLPLLASVGLGAVWY